MGNASHNVPPRKAVLNMKIVAILNAAFKSNFRDGGWDGDVGVVVP